MMKIFKVKFFLLILILFSLISVSAVSAGEDDLKNSSQGNFTELNQEFSNSVDSVNLTKDFVHGDEEDDLKRDETLVKYFMPNARKFNCKDKKSPLFTIEGIGVNEERRCRWGGYKRKCFW